VRKRDFSNAAPSARDGGIPNLAMPPVTTVFRVQDPTALDRLKVGDPVRFRAGKIGGQYTVTSIEARK
jgi:Cu(I)/Ag(I) efflux system protein CusF